MGARITADKIGEGVVLSPGSDAARSLPSAERVVHPPSWGRAAEARAPAQTVECHLESLVVLSERLRLRPERRDFGLEGRPLSTNLVDFGVV
jgi:hypothetical protein